MGHGGGGWLGFRVEGQAGEDDMVEPYPLSNFHWAPADDHSSCLTWLAFLVVPMLA